MLLSLNTPITMKKYILPLVLSSFLAAAECRRTAIIPKVIATKQTSKTYCVESTHQLVQRGGDGGDVDTHQQTKVISTKKAVAIGCLLALNSGLINGVCLSGLIHPTKQASAAVTGAWTNSALGAATGNKQAFTFNFRCILSYLGGSLIAGLVNPNPITFEIASSSIRSALWIGSLLLYVSYRVAEKGGVEYIFLAASAMGIQNSLTSTTTANLVRSAHFSGITSDLGTFLGQVLRGNTQNLIKLKVFFSLAISFWVGGWLSYSLTKQFGTQMLLFSSLLYLLLGFGSIAFRLGCVVM